ncbi:MAG: cytochrome c [Rhodospirillaceae bacterium]|nr:MAG: cytochrome c [Rhodospirillaceae bacterium]
MGKVFLTVVLAGLIGGAIVPLAGKVALSVAAAAAEDILPCSPQSASALEDKNEATAWSRIEAVADPTAYEAFLACFPNGAYAPMARARLDVLKSRYVAPSDSAAPCPPAEEPEEAGVCRKCHAFEVGKASRPTGPNLATIFGRRIGSVDDFRFYSEGLRAAAAQGVIWDAAQLDAYLKDPRGFLARMVRDPNVKHNMFFKMADDLQRARIVTYLQTIATCR